MTNKFSLVKFFFFVLVLASSSLFIFPTQTQAADGGPIPPAPQKVWAQSGPNAGEVTLYWDEAPHADRYALEYGTSSNQYQYGAVNIGDSRSRSYTVKYLASGTTYYFRLAAAHGSASSPFSAETKAVATAGMVTLPSVASPKSAVSVGPVTPKAAVSNKMVWARSNGMHEVTVSWTSMASADNYHIVYGTQPGKYSYGALNIGKTNSFKIGMLASGTTYYVAIVPVMNNRALFTTAPASVTTDSGTWAETVETTPANLIQPKETTMIEPAAGEATPEVLMKKNDVQGVSDYVPPTTDNVNGYQEGTVIQRNQDGAGDRRIPQNPNDYNR